MQILVLGPLEVADGSIIDISRPKDRALLTILAAEADATVSADRLIDGLWGENPPVSAVRTLRTYVHHLRSILPNGAIVTDSPGYRLASGPEAVDAHRFPALVAEARRHLESDPAAADQMLTEALQLWRGEPFVDADRAEWLRPVRTRLEGLRLQAVVDSLDARLRLGRHDAVVPELRSIVEEHPLREDLWGLLMLALYRSGRQAEALRAYTAARHHLAEELGIDPGPDLQALEGRILAQDPGLLPEVAGPDPYSVPGGAAQAETAPAPPEERRLATLVFGELAGVDELSAGLGSDTAGIVLSESTGIMADAVERLGGTVIAGDEATVLASFGIPVARDDDAYRAIRSALAIRSDIASYGRDIERTWSGVCLAARVGVASMAVTVPLDSDRRVTDAVAPVRALGAAAGPDEVVVDDHTRRRVEDLFVWDRDPRQIGEGAPAWRVEAVRRTSDKARMSRRIHAPFVGREEEVDAIRAAIDSLQRGLGGVVIVSGEAGVGKSRLLEELHAATAGPAKWLLGHCAAYAEAMPYWPFRDLLRDWLALGIDDTMLKARVALHAQLERSVDAGERLYPYLAGMLGVTLGAPHARRLEVAPEALQYRTFEVVGELFEALARRGPLVVAIEDVHWADPTSVQLLERLLELSDRTALLLILTSRPDPDHSSHRLGELARRRLPHRLVELSLSSLPGPAQQALLAGLVGAETLPPATTRRLLDLAEGNPFYLEELVGSLVDAGALVQVDGRWIFDHEVPLSVPETVEKVVQARIDRLDAHAHDLVTSAAVLGRSFGLPLLQGALGEPPGLLDALQQLLRLDLLVEARRWPQAEYLFKHALIQEAAYATLPHDRRRDIHRRAAQWLERRHTGNIDEVAGLVANHWAAAGDDDRATDALLRAGDVARSGHALDEAIDHYRTLLPILERRGDRRSTALVLLKLAHALHTALRFSESNAAYQRAFDLWEYAPSPPATATLRFAGPPHFRPADPIRSYFLADMQLQMALFDRLVERWPDDTLVPSLAERWEVSDDGLRYRFTLRPDLLWSDGHPLSAADAAYGVMRNLDPERPGVSVAMLYVIEGARDHVLGIESDTARVGIEAIDGRTVEFRLVHPAPYFLSMLNRPDCGPQPRHAVKRFGDAWSDVANEVVSGAFFREAHTAEKVTLVRRSDYQGSRFGNVARVDWRPGPYDEAADLFVKGRQDVVWIGGGWEGGLLDQIPADQVYPGLPAGLQYLVIDHRHPSVTRAEVRRALAHAIDREALAAVLSFDSTIATGGVVPPPLPGHTPDIALRFDPDLARSLISGARWPAPLPIATHSRFEPLPSVVAEQWRTHLGIEVEVVELSFEDFLRLPGDLPSYAVFPWSWYPGFSDPEYFLRLLLASDAMDNRGRWNHPPYDELIKEAVAERDERRRLELFHAADRMAVVEEAALLPLAYSRNTSLQAPHVRGWWEFGKSWSSFADLTIMRRSR